MPYVLPFFSFRPLGDGRIWLDHALTGQQATVDEATLEALERLHHGGTADAALAGRMERMHILFPSREAAERWLDARDLSTGRAVPLVDQIELTNRCPYRCKMCPRTSSMTRGVGDMDLALFDRIIAQIAPNQDYVGLHHFGESLLHRDLVAAVARARSQGVKTGLSCNPPSLKPPLAQRLLDAGIADLVLSLDSLDPATYRSIRGSAARLDQALRHLEALVRLRDEGGHVTTITLQLIHMHENAAEADRFLSYCRDIGVDRGVVVRLGRWDFPDDKVEALGSFTSPLHGDYCNRPSQSVVVLWDGRVVPCCHDYNGAEVLGTLARQTLQDVWDSPAARAFRGNWNTTALCRQCAFGRTFREARRATVGFRAFHQAPSPTPALEYVAERQRAPRHFDGFDVLHV